MTPSSSTQNLLTFLARALLALLFIPAGFGKVVGFAGVTGYIASKGLPLPQVAAALAIAIELGLGLLLLFGWKARWAALGLVIFLAVITPIFHNFWAVPAAQVTAQQINFYKNLSVLGGLLLLVAFGPGGWSFDGKRQQAA